jgi:tetratricopeptide (TPR) repeat protein
MRIARYRLRKLKFPLAPLTRVLAAFLLALPAHAEIIYLKNGRTIVAEGIVESGDKLTYEGSYGQVTIPRNQVERVERGGPLPPRLDPNRPDAASTPATGAPRTTSDLPLTLRLPTGNDSAILLSDGTVNERLLADLGRDAWDGDIQRQNALNAHMLAAAYEVRKSRTAAAHTFAEQALVFASQDRNALMLAAQIDLLSRNYSEAREHLLVAQANFPQAADILGLLGYASYYVESADRAMFYWKQAYALSPEPALKALIDRMERESVVESAQREAESYHFRLNWEGPDKSEQFGKEVLETLERHFREIEVSLYFTPREPIAVILYTGQQYRDITRAPSWSGAVNDGKIRVPVQGLTSMTADLSRLLKHELTHSFVFQFVQRSAPVWLNEGIAQVEAGESSSEFAQPLARIFAASRQLRMSALEGSFMRYDSRTALVAYAQSVAAVEMIREKHGAYLIPEILKVLRDGRPLEEAIRSVLRLGYQELDDELAAYVHAKYIR